MGKASRAECIEIIKSQDSRESENETFFAMLFTKIKSCKLKLTAIMHLESERGALDTRHKS